MHKHINVQVLKFLYVHVSLMQQHSAQISMMHVTSDVVT